MHETYGAPNQMVDPTFSGDIAKDWPTPDFSKHINFYQTQEKHPGEFRYEVAAPDNQEELIEAMLAKYREQDVLDALDDFDGDGEVNKKGHVCGIGELFKINVDGLDILIEEPSAFGNYDYPMYDPRGRRDDRLLVATSSMNNEYILSKGFDARYGSHFVGEYVTVFGEVPQGVHDMLADIYKLTNAMVIRDDRTDPSQTRYRRYLQGNFKGKQILFIEQSSSSHFNNDDLPEFTVTVTDNFRRLSEMSQAQAAQLAPIMNPRIAMLNYPEAQAKIEEMTFMGILAASGGAESFNTTGTATNDSGKPDSPGATEPPTAGGA